MLHILWMIFKFILIVLGILLGLLVLALLTLLFCPVCYRGEVSGNMDEWKKAQGIISISWLFRGITIRLRFADGMLTHSIHILGISLEKLKRKKISGESGNKASVPEGPAESVSSPVLTKHDKTNTETSDCSDTSSAEPDNTKEKGPGFLRRIWNKISAFLDKLKKIPDFIRNFSSKIQSIYDKIDYWKQFLTHPRVKEAISFAWGRLKRLLKHIFPTRIEGQVTFGSEDPSVTGAVLAFLGMTMPFHKNCIEIHPVFEGSNLLEGDVRLRGRIYGIVVLVTALQIYFHKNIKYVIYRWRHRKS